MGNTTYCNPLDLGYRYQHIVDGEKKCGYREGADPTLVYFKERYYLFVSMSAGFWHSTDLLNWEFHADEELLIYDYAPDVRQIGDYLYFCASRRLSNSPILRTKDPLGEPFVEVAAPFPFWDPDLFCDDDGRVYLYWGCTNTDPIYGIELDPETLQPIGEQKELIFERSAEFGYERVGENGVSKKEDSMLYQSIKHLFNPETQRIELPPEVPVSEFCNEESLTKMFLSIGKPFIEGAFMTKHKGRYYLQYACPGTEFNTYGDGVYVSDSPLGPFAEQEDNPFSSKPGGFIAGAGHGSTIRDCYGNYWHAATMRISVNHEMERRVGLFPAGFDEDGILFCNQNFADYPRRIPEGSVDPKQYEPEWMLLNYGKPVEASSTAAGSEVRYAVDEDVRTWWSAGKTAPGEWLVTDLERESDIYAIQVNLADENLVVQFPPESYGDERHIRHIELRPQISQYRIEVSSDKENWTVLEEVNRECVNGYYEYPEGVQARYVRVTGGELPYGQALRVSGLRIFGRGKGPKPGQTKAVASRVGDLDAKVEWTPAEGAQGYNVRYGIRPDKLYHSWMVYGDYEVTISTLMKDHDYYVCVDSFNENGITCGETIKVDAVP